MKQETGRALARIDRTRPVVAGLALNLLLVLAAWWRTGQVGAVWLVPEAWIVTALAALLPDAGGGRVGRVLLSTAFALTTVLLFCDALVQSVLGRPLNVFVDALMLEAGFHLVDGSLGRAAAVAAAIAFAAAICGLAAGVYRIVGFTAGAGRAVALGQMGAALASVLLAAAPLQVGVALQLPGLWSEQAQRLAETRSMQAALRAAVDDPAFRARSLPALAGRDVYIVFVESYGVSALDRPRHAADILPRLSRLEGGLAAADLRALSGRIAAPIRGGQSWLSHATFLSGLEIDNNLWYRRLLSLDIDLMTSDFRATGHVPVAVAPAIVRAWPEAARLGFERVYAAADLGYEGPRLGWVTMPDEYTLHAFSQRLRPAIEGPVFAHIALISSHWPWAPVIEPLPEPGKIGRGRVFERFEAGASEVLSLASDPAALRAAYGRSVGYSLEVVFRWAERRLPSDALLIVLGDHQPTSLITGRQASAAVPIHVVSGDPDLLQGFDRRGFSEGLVPDSAGPSAGMEELRRWLRDDFAAR